MEIASLLDKIEFGTIADWVQVLVGAAASIATILALKVAIESGDRQQRDNEKVFRESVRNRQDDAMPILSLIKRHHLQPNSTFYTYNLKNKGNGPLFELCVTQPAGSKIQHMPEEEGFDYYIIIPADAIDNSDYVEYTYTDLYNRKFMVRQKVIKEDKIISGEFTKPKKIA